MLVAQRALAPLLAEKFTVYAMDLPSHGTTLSTGQRIETGAPLVGLPSNQVLFLPNRHVNVPITSFATCLCRVLGIPILRARLPSMHSALLFLDGKQTHFNFLTMSAWCQKQTNSTPKRRPSGPAKIGFGQSGMLV